MLFLKHQKKLLQFSVHALKDWLLIRLLMYVMPLAPTGMPPLALAQHAIIQDSIGTDQLQLAHVLLEPHSGTQALEIAQHLLAMQLTQLGQSPLKLADALTLPPTIFLLSCPALLAMLIILPGYHLTNPALLLLPVTTPTHSGTLELRLAHSFVMLTTSTELIPVVAVLLPAQTALLLMLTGSPLQVLPLRLAHQHEHERYKSADL